MLLPSLISCLDETEASLIKLKKCEGGGDAHRYQRDSQSDGLFLPWGAGGAGGRLHPRVNRFIVRMNFR